MRSRLFFFASLLTLLACSGGQSPSPTDGEPTPSANTPTAPGSTPTAPGKTPTAPGSTPTPEAQSTPTFTLASTPTADHEPTQPHSLIEGDVVLTNSADVASVRDVTAIGGDLIIHSDGSGSAFELPTLTTIGGSLLADALIASDALSFPELSAVGGDISVFDSQGVDLTDFLENLTAIEGDVLLACTDCTVSQTLANLSEGSSVEISGSYNGRDILGNLTTLDWGLDINVTGPAPTFPKLTTIAKYIHATEGDLSGAFPALIGHRALNFDGPVQLNGAFPNLTILTGQLSLSNEAVNLSEVILPKLQTADAVAFAFCGPVDVDATGLSHLQAVGGLAISDCEGRVADLSDFSATIGGALYLSNFATVIPPAEGLSFEGPADITMTKLDHIQFSSNLLADGTQILHLNLTKMEALTTIADDLPFAEGAKIVVTDCDALQQLNLASLPSSIDVLLVNKNDQLAHMADVSGLVSASSLAITDSPLLTTLPTFPDLETVGGYLSLNNNGASSMDVFPKLSQTGGLSLYDNPALTAVSGLPVFTSTGNINIVGNNILTDISGLSSLQSAGTVTVRLNPNLPTCDVEDLFESIPQTGAINITDNLSCE